MRNLLYIALCICSFSTAAQEHYEDVNYYPTLNVFLTDNTPSYYDSSDNLAFDAYVLQKIDQSYYPLFVTVDAQKEDGTKVQFRYTPNKGNISREELNAAIGEQVVIRYKRYAGHFIALKVELIK